MELIVAQCKAILCPRTQLTVYCLNAASAQDTFCYDKKKIRQWSIWSNQA